MRKAWLAGRGVVATVATAAAAAAAGSVGVSASASPSAAIAATSADCEVLLRLLFTFYPWRGLILNCFTRPLYGFFDFGECSAQLQVILKSERIVSCQIPIILNFVLHRAVLCFPASKKPFVVQIRKIKEFCFEKASNSENEVKTDQLNFELFYLAILYFFILF